MCQEIEHQVTQKNSFRGGCNIKHKYANKCIAFFLTLVMIFSLSSPAFAASPSDSSQIAAAQQAFEYLTPEQKNTFIREIEKIAWYGDTSLVEFHHNYIDPTYNYDPSTISPPVATRAVDIAAQLQQLNLPTAVYYGLLAFATALGVPVGNVVDIVIGLGLAAIIVANWDAIKDVWDDIVDIFVNAFGSVVNDAFDYIQGQIFNAKFNKSAEDVINGADGNKQNHIINNKKHDHGWEKIFGGKKPDWNQLAPILIKALQEGDEIAESGGTYLRTLSYKGYEVCVRFLKDAEGLVSLLSTAWLQ